MWPWSTIAMLRRELDEVKQTLAYLKKQADDDLFAAARYKKDIAKRDSLIDAMRGEIATLAADLAEARKNDSPQDPKTGRFTKKAKNV